MTTISPVSAAVAGALISGVAMYAVGPRADKVDAFAQPATAYVQTVDGQIIPVTPTVPPAGVSSLQSGFVPVAAQPAPVVPQRTVYRTAAPAAQRVVVEERRTGRTGRSWQKTAMVIGGSAAGGAGVGAIVGGKKGALIGAALGGGAASIYEATKR